MNRLRWQDRTAILVALALASVVAIEVDSFEGVADVPPDSLDAIGWIEVDPQPWPDLDFDGLTPLSTSATSKPEISTISLVNFWASTCRPCRDELPLLARVDRSGEFDVVGISRDLGSDFANETIRSLKADYPHFLDADAALSEALGETLPTNAIPVSLLVVKGMIEWIHIGAFDSASSLIAFVRAHSA